MVAPGRSSKYLERAKRTSMLLGTVRWTVGTRLEGVEQTRWGENEKEEEETGVVHLLKPMHTLHRRPSRLLSIVDSVSEASGQLALPRPSLEDCKVTGRRIWNMLRWLSGDPLPLLGRLQRRLFYFVFNSRFFFDLRKFMSGGYLPKWFLLAW